MWRVVCALIAGAVPGDPVSQGHQLAAEAVTAKAKLRKSLRGDRQQFLLVNVFEEDCFNPGRDEVQYDQFKTFAQTSEVPRLWDEETMRSTYAYSLANKKQYFMSCGQFNNVMHMLMHALAVARALNRTLVLPGFYFRKGTKLQALIWSCWRANIQLSQVCVERASTRLKKCGFQQGTFLTGPV